LLQSRPYPVQYLSVRRELLVPPPEWVVVPLSVLAMAQAR
jgi:hypothetical protein